MSRFDKTYCSQCGGEFGPGNGGFSHCDDHGLAAVLRLLDEAARLRDVGDIRARDIEDRARELLRGATALPAPLPESMSRDQMLSYYSEYANMVANEVTGYQKQIRDLKAALAKLEAK